MAYKCLRLERLKIKFQSSAGIAESYFVPSGIYAGPSTATLTFPLKNMCGCVYVRMHVYELVKHSCVEVGSNWEQYTELHKKEWSEQWWSTYYNIWLTEP